MLRSLIQVGLFIVCAHAALAKSPYELEFNVNGVHLRYDLSPLTPFHCMQPHPHLSGSIALARGKSIFPFYTTTDGPFTLFIGRDVGPVAFASAVGALNNPRLTLDQLPSQDRPHGDSEHMLFPYNKPSAIVFTTVNSRRWLVTTKFEDSKKTMVLSRSFWTLESGLRVAISIFFKENAPKDVIWREKRLALLEELVRSFRLERQ